MTAAHFGLDNLCGIVDVNGVQLDGPTKEIMNVEPVADKFRAFNWNVIEIDGHDLDQVSDAFESAAKFKGAPSVIVARCVKGKGVSFMENDAGWHGKAPNDEQYAQAHGELLQGLMERMEQAGLPASEQTATTYGVLSDKEGV